MNTDNTMVSVAEVDENMAIVQKKMAELQWKIVELEEEVSLINSEEMENEEKIAGLENENERLRKEVATLKEGEIAHLGKIDLLQHQLAGGVLHTPVVVQDINGKDVKVPSEEECQQMFGVSQEEFIVIAKGSDCQY